MRSNRASAFGIYTRGSRWRRSDLLLTDADRERAAHTLRQALAEGSLTVDEAEGRLEAAYAARREHELVPVLEDLPQHVARRSRSLDRRPTFRLRARLVAFGVIAALVASSLVGAHHGHGGGAVWVLWVVGFFALRTFFWRGRRHRRWSGLPSATPGGHGKAG